MKNTTKAIQTTTTTSSSVTALRKKQGGFSLNEILVAVAIMGTVAAFALPYVNKITSGVDQKLAESAAETITQEWASQTRLNTMLGSSDALTACADFKVKGATITGDLTTGCTVTVGKSTAKSEKPTS